MYAHSQTRHVSGITVIGYSRNMSCWLWAYMMTVIPETCRVWLWVYIMTVIPETCRVDYERTWWLYSRNVSCWLWAYIMTVIKETCCVDYERTWWRLFQKCVVFDCECTWWRLFQKRIALTMNVHDDGYSRSMSCWLWAYTITFIPETCRVDY
jgi:hypothetical protein